MSERLDDLDPLDPEDHARQLEAVLELAGTNGRSSTSAQDRGVLLHPQGRGRGPAVDLDPEVLRSGDWSKPSGVSTLVEDFLDDRASWPARGPFQTALPGNTLALLTKHREVERSSNGSPPPWSGGASAHR